MVECFGQLLVPYEEYALAALDYANEVIAECGGVEQEHLQRGTTDTRSFHGEGSDPLTNTIRAGCEGLQVWGITHYWTHVSVRSMRQYEDGRTLETSRGYPMDNNVVRFMRLVTEGAYPDLMT